MVLWHPPVLYNGNIQRSGHGANKSAEYAKTKLYKTTNSSVSVGALTFTTVQLQLVWVTQPRQGDNYKYWMIIQPATPTPIPPSLCTSRRNTSLMTHLSLYLCPEYLCRHVTAKKGWHCFPHRPIQFPNTPISPSPLPPSAAQALKVAVTLLQKTGSLN